MEEFIEKFNEFKEWLDDMHALNPEEVILLEKIRNKFNELGLNNAF